MKTPISKSKKGFSLNSEKKHLKRLAHEPKLFKT